MFRRLFVYTSLFTFTFLARAQITGIRSDYHVGEIPRLCQAALNLAKAKIDAIATLRPEERTFATTTLALETTLADLGDQVQPLQFMMQVAPDPKIAAESAECVQRSSAFGVELTSRRDLYNVLKNQIGSDADEQRLQLRTLQGFEEAGMNLPDDKLAQVKDLNLRLETVKNTFQANRNKDKSRVLYSAEDLNGVRPDYMAELVKRMKPEDQGKLAVTTRENDALEIFQNVKSADARRRFYLAFYNRAAVENGPLLEEAVQLRLKIAKLMGYNAWSDLRLVNRMAKTTSAVMTFLNDMKDRLSGRTRSDLNELLAYKRETEPTATSVEPWEKDFFVNQLKKRKFNLDNDRIREYFPAEVVIKGLFEVYSQVLGVTYEEVVNAPVWAPGVKLYEIHDKSSNRLIGFFYTDFFGRENKYDHAAAFSLIDERKLANGKRNFPISAIVANISPGANGKPALLLHSEVEVIFHEFGHVMHGTLSQAPYASLAGTHVARDFVEAPSQMLENWVWQPEVLNKLSGHYLDHSKKLPPDLLASMIGARDFQQGTFWSRQLALALFDMKIHSENPGDNIDETFLKLYYDVTGMKFTPDSHFPAVFGHLMGGYDSGYYSYAWSKVYAQDMFTLFQTGGPLNADLGQRYRSVILANGDMQDATDLLTQFLGRPPNTEAFFKFLHL